MAITQARAAGGLTGRRYGSFGGRGDGAHPVAAITQPRAVAAYTGKRYGIFAGRGAPDLRLTQPRAHGAYSGRRYGPFGGKTPGDEVLPPIPTLPPRRGRVTVPIELRLLQRQRLIQDDELLLALLVAAVPGLMRRH